MKKLILALALVVTFVACSGPSSEAVAPTVDTTAVAVDTTVAAPADTTAVDTSKVK